MASGDRTNPWQQEVSSRMIRPGDLVVFDCGMVGPFAYGADISRTYFCGPGKPSAAQKRLYSHALAEVRHNSALMQPGAAFEDIVARRFIQPDDIGGQPYPCLAHGLGMADEWPVILHPRDAEYAFEGELEVGMVICVESYVGEIGGIEGVKLENMVLVTESGPITLSRYPFEEELMIEL
jgi:Xaa-Pro aminopeptidase